ncbi:hypothetical protein D3C76_492560 [compost metagenome]
MFGNVITRLLLAGLLGAATTPILAAGGSPTAGPDPARPTSAPEGSNALPSNPSTGNGGDADGSSLFGEPDRAQDEDIYRRPEVDPDHPREPGMDQDEDTDSPMGNGSSGG